MIWFRAAKVNCRKTRRFDAEMVRNIIVLIGSLTKLSEDACHQVRDATAPEVARKRWLSEVRSAQGVRIAARVVPTIKTVGGMAPLSTMWEGLDQ
jgi:hypothetical protein